MILFFTLMYYDVQRRSEELVVGNADKFFFNLLFCFQVNLLQNF